MKRPSVVVINSQCKCWVNIDNAVPLKKYIYSQEMIVEIKIK